MRKLWIAILSIALLISCGGNTNNTSSDDVYKVEKELCRYKSNLVADYIYINGEHDVNYYHSIGSSLLSVDLGNNKIDRQPVMKRIKFKEYTVEIVREVAKQKTMLVYFNKETVEIPKVVDYGDIVSNDNGVFLVTDKNISKFNLDTGDLLWTQEYNKDMLVPNENIIVETLSYEKPKVSKYEIHIELFNCKNYFILYNGKSYWHVDSNNGLIKKIELANLTGRKIINQGGFVYNNEFYYVNTSFDLVKYPDKAIANIKDVLSNVNSTYISLYHNYVIVSNFDKYTASLCDEVDNIEIYKMDVGLRSSIQLLNMSMIPNKSVLLYSITDKQPINLNSMFESEKLAAIVNNDSLLVYTDEKKIYCLDDKLRKQWVYDYSNDKNAYFNPYVIWHNDKRVLIDYNQSELIIYDLL